MNSIGIGNELPFCNLHDDQFLHIIKQSNLKLSDHDITKLKQLTFNPFSIDDRGKPYLTMDTNLDPDNNYYNHIIILIIVITMMSRNLKICYKLPMRQSFRFYIAT